MGKNCGLTLGSLFDGSGGFPLGGLLCGITPKWASEVEPFAIRVTTKRLPQVKHLGDINRIHGSSIEPVDIITFGSPCQDMSIAGKRAGLDGSRSNLFYEAIRIIKEMRCATDGKYPRFIVWENVPGAFSSNKGEDFRAVLEEVCSVKGEFPVPRPEKWAKAGEIVGDGFSVAWRTFDAQYWGVPQRRRRIYLVADFASGCAGKILFESEGLSGYPPQGGCPWERTAGTAENCVNTAGGAVCLNDQGGQRMDVTEEVTNTLRAESGHPPCVVEPVCDVPAVFENHSQDGRYTGPLEIAQTVLATYGTGGNNQPFVVETPKTLKIRSGCSGGGKGALVQDNLSATLSTNNDQTVFVPKAYGICSKASNAMQSDNPHSGFYEAETSRTLDANGGNPSCNQGGMAVVAVQGSMIGRQDRNGPQGDGVNQNVSFTLNTVDRHAVAYAEMVRFPAYCMPTGNYGVPVKEKSPTLMARDYKDPPVVNEAAYTVRRLTPKECARLQGFPDWWCEKLGTQAPSKKEIVWWADVFETQRLVVGKSSRPKTERQITKWLQNPYSDSAEYRLWGNGVALPNVCFVLAGIVYYTQNHSL